MQPQPQPRKPKRRRFFTLKGRRNLPRWLYVLAAFLVRLLRRTYRTTVVDPEGFMQSGQPWPAIFVVWHNRILFTADFFPRHIREGTTAIVSASRDGEYAAQFIRHFGLQVVRGSSSRGGYHALRELKRQLDENGSVILTLDGPRGPKYQVQPGAAGLAEISGIPIVPISVNAPRRWELGGWDATQIPRPFSKVELRIGAPLKLSATASPEDREAATARLREALLSITDDQKR